MNLQSNEELLVQRCKKRPAIILSSGVECFPDIAKLLKQKGKKHQQQDCLFVIPCYNVQTEEYGTGFIQPIVARTQCLMYRQFFYKNTKSKALESSGVTGLSIYKPLIKNSACVYAGRGIKFDISWKIVYVVVIFH